METNDLLVGIILLIGIILMNWKMLRSKKNDT